MNLCVSSFKTIGHVTILVYAVNKCKNVLTNQEKKKVFIGQTNNVNVMYTF